MGNQLENRRGTVMDLISKGKQLLENPDKPKFIDSHIARIKGGWDLTKEKATQRLQLLNDTKAAWEGYYAGLENIAVEFEKAEEEITKVKKRFNLQMAKDDLAKRQKIFNDTKKTIDDMYAKLEKDFNMMTLTLPEDKKDFVKKELKGVTDKLEVVGRFKDKVDKMEQFVNSLNEFDVNLKTLDTWMKEADAQLDQIKNHSDKMTPEDRVSCTMELQEDVGEKADTIKKMVSDELDLLPQGDSVPKDAQDHKDELKRIQDYVMDLQKRVMTQCEKFSDGLSKPSTLDEAQAMFATVNSFDQNCLKHMKILENAEQASLKMTTHKEADDEVKALKER